MASLDQLAAELPNAKSVSLVVSWFGDDLRCDRCTLRPAVEQGERGRRPDALGRVGAGSRASARVVSRLDGRPIFGGTPADASVLQAIARMKADGHVGDVLSVHPDGHPGGERAARPLDRRGGPAAGAVAGADHAGAGAGAAGLERQDGGGGGRRWRRSSAGLRSATSGVGDSTVDYDGPAEWSYRRFVLHYAHLCALAGGVDAFCIGSELRGLTQIRDSADGYPAVRALCSWRRRSGRFWGRHQDRLCGRLVGVLRAPAGRRVGRRALQPRSALGVAGDRLHRDRQLHAAFGLARRDGPRRCRRRVDLRPRLPDGQCRRRRGVRLVLCRRGGACRAGSAFRSRTAPTARTGSSATRTWSAGGRSRTSTASVA